MKRAVSFQEGLNLTANHYMRKCHSENRLLSSTKYKDNSLYIKDELSERTKMKTPVNICDNEPKENDFPCIDAGSEDSCDVSDNNTVDSLILKLQIDFEQWTKLRVDTICKLRDIADFIGCLLYTSPSPRDATLSRMPSSA